MTVHPEIEKRLRRQAPSEAETSVMSGTLPVISFGDAFAARVATIALNPSWAEFHGEGKTEPKKRFWLEGDDRRLTSLHSLGLTSSDELTDEQVDLAYQECVDYFQRKPYKLWFGSLNTYLNYGLDADYYDGSACHLDLVQWATAKKQSDVVKDLPGAWERLVESDAGFLRWQMQTTSAETFVINGMHVIEVLMASDVIPKMSVQAKTFTSDQGFKKTVEFFTAQEAGKTFLGWNIPAASALSAEARQWIIERCQEFGGTPRTPLRREQMGKSLEALSLPLEIRTLAQAVAELIPVQATATTKYVSLKATADAIIGVYLHRKRISIALDPTTAEVKANEWPECVVEDQSETTSYLHVPLSLVASRPTEIRDLCVVAIKRGEEGTDGSLA